MSNPVVDLAELAALPDVVRELQDRVRTLEGQLAQPDDGQLLDVGAAAALLQMTSTAVRQAAYRGSIPSVRIGRRLRFRRSELLRLR
jgi:excisionase family DNA binding protein